MELRSIGHRVIIHSVRPRLLWPFYILPRYQAAKREDILAMFVDSDRDVPHLPGHVLAPQVANLWKHRLRRYLHGVSSIEIDVVHAHTLFPAGLIGGWVAEKKAALLCTSHGADTRVYIRRHGTRMMVSRAIGQASGVSCVGRAIAESLRPLMSGRADPVVIPNGVALERFVQVDRSGRGRLKIVAVGNLELTKGFDILIRAFSQCAVDYPEWDLQIAGYGAQYMKLSELIASLGLCKRVTLLGMVEPGAVPAFLGTGDIFCLPSWSEGFGIVYIEALASRLPVVAIRGQGVTSEIVRAGAGFAAEPRDPVNLASCLRVLMANRELRCNMGDRGFELVCAQYTWRRIAHKYEILYEDIVERRKRQRIVEA